MDCKVCWVLWIGRWHKLQIICLMQPWFAPSCPPYFLSDCSAYYITLDLATYLWNMTSCCHDSHVTCRSQVTCLRLQAEPAELLLQLKNAYISGFCRTYIRFFLGCWGFLYFYIMHQQAGKLNARDFTSYKQVNWNDLARATALSAKFPPRSMGPEFHLWLYWVWLSCS